VLSFNRSNGLTFAGDISGTGGVEKLGAGALSLSGNNSYGGVTDILDGSVRAITNNSLSANSAFRVNDGASLLIGNGLDVSIGSLADGPAGGGIVQVGTSAPLTRLVIGGNNAGTTFSGVFAGAGGIEKEGSGVFTLTGLGSSLGEGLAVSQGTVDVKGGSIGLGSEVAMLGGVLQITDGGLVTAAGDTIIAPAGTLKLGAGGLAGSLVTPNIDNSGAIVADFTDTSTLAANILGTGTLTKDGSGKLILTGNSTYTGATTVDGGTLAVNGSIGSSPVTVNDGSTLAGTGIVGTTIVNDGGAIGPGNSPGTLTVRNSLAFGAGSPMPSRPVRRPT
jgi:autotransporter-associated beta strand protein